jgi:hypothetical protein
MPPPNGHPVPGQQRSTSPGPLPARSAAVPLRRLLGLATLTPAQAAHVAVLVLGSLDADQPGYGPFDAGDVLVDEDGSVRLVDRDTAVQPGTARAASALVDQLARNADRPAAHRRPANASLLAALASCATQLLDGDLEAPRIQLAQALETAGVDRAVLSRELAALVAVPLIRVGAEPGNPLADVEAIPEGVVDPSPPPQPALPQNTLPQNTALPPVLPPRRGTQVMNRRITPGQLIAAAVGAVLVVAGIVAAIVLTRPSSHPARAATRPPSPTSHAATPSTHPSARPGPRAVPTLAPAAVGPISAVTVRPAGGSCSAGRSCAATVTIHLRPPSLSQLSWHAAVVDRCTGAVTTVDRGSMIAEPGWTSIYATVALPLPKKSSMALVAVVDSPVAAASKPLLVPAGGGSCARR